MTQNPFFRWTLISLFWILPLHATETMEHWVQAVEQILRSSFPEAQVKLNEDGVYEFSHNLREFVVYRPNKVGDWQEPRTTLAPDRGGIEVKFSIRQGPWGGALMIPHVGTKDLYLFKETHVVMNSADKSEHLWAQIRTPRVDAPDEVLQQLIELFQTYRE